MVKCDNWLGIHVMQDGSRLVSSYYKFPLNSGIIFDECIVQSSLN